MLHTNYFIIFIEFPEKSFIVDLNIIFIKDISSISIYSIFLNESNISMLINHKHFSTSIRLLFTFLHLFIIKSFDFSESILMESH
jgi:hypothetical protein